MVILATFFGLRFPWSPFRRDQCISFLHSKLNERLPMRLRIRQKDDISASLPLTLNHLEDGDCLCFKSV